MMELVEFKAFSTTKSRMVRDDLEYILFSEIYSRFSAAKSNRQAFRLLESAIECFARKGFENVTLQMIAREAGVTRPLLRHYILDLEDIRDTAIKYVRLLFQKLAIDSMTKGQNSSMAISLYIEACFLWTKNFKNHSKVWLAYMSLCISQKRHREVNTAAVQVGEARIAALLEKGKAMGEFDFHDAKMRAKLLQVIITGAMVTLACEDLPDPRAYLSMIQKECLNAVKKV